MLHIGEKMLEGNVTIFFTILNSSNTFLIPKTFKYLTIQEFNMCEVNTVLENNYLNIHFFNQITL